MEIHRFKSESLEILVPNLYGISTKSPVEPKRKRWSEEEFFRALAENVGVGIVQIVRDLYDWSREEADRI